MGTVNNPFFWALVSMFGLVGANAVVSGKKLGVLLTPLWWIGLLIHTLIEEESLERELGQKFYEYKKQSKGRIFPGLPI
jgi:protein-S-isoprenylcysteine O-methyltransferase Ste14